MKKNKKESAADLRRQAETQLQGSPALPPADPLRMVHELQVHRMELEMQNEELERSRTETEASLARYTDLYDFAPVGYVTIDDQGVIRQANLAAADLLGTPRGKLLGMCLGPLVAAADRPAYNTFQQAVLAAQVRACCDVALAEQDPPRFVRLEATAAGSGVGCRVALVDITDRQQAKEALRRSVAELAEAQTLATMGSWRVVFHDGQEAWTGSDAFYRLWHFSVGTPLTLPSILERIHPDDRARHAANWAAALTNTGPIAWEHRIIVADQVKWIAVRVAIRHDIQGRPLEVTGINQDVTERKLAELERESTVAFLRLVNTGSDLHDLVAQAVSFFRRQSGCSAVGLRLRDGDDYPYYVAQGFPEQFIKAENSLCCRAADGQVERDAIGNPVLACMCGNVICGRFDASQPFFSASGSFWSNGTTELLARTTAQDRQARTRNRCNGEGYESVALIALRVGTECFGLLQLNDRRKNMFTPASIALWERLGGYLAVALAHRRSQDEVQRSHAILQAIIEGTPDAVFTKDLAGRYQSLNRAAAAFIGQPRDAVLGKDDTQLFPPEVACQVQAMDREAIATGTVRSVDETLRTPMGDVIFHVTKGPIVDAQGRVQSTFGIARDITERRRIEMELRQQAEELRVRNEELSRFNNVAVGRELRMIALKAEVNELAALVGQPPRYPAVNSAASPLRSPEAP